MSLTANFWHRNANSPPNISITSHSQQTFPNYFQSFSNIKMTQEQQQNVPRSAGCAVRQPDETVISDQSLWEYSGRHRSQSDGAVQRVLVVRGLGCAGGGLEWLEHWDDVHCLVNIWITQKTQTHRHKGQFWGRHGTKTELDW